MVVSRLDAAQQRHLVAFHGSLLEALAAAGQSLDLARVRCWVGGQALLVLLETKLAVHTAKDLGVQLWAARLQASVGL